MTISPNPSHLSELTVTCHQCGSVSMDRLDRKEYRCTHCGAITVISDDDADRLESLLREALSRPTPAAATPPTKLSGARIGILVAALTGAGVIVPLLIANFNDTQQHSSGRRITQQRTVPVDEVTISQLSWNKDKRRYEGTIYNHSGYPITVPRYTMTLFTNGHRSGSTWSEVAVDRLLPGEYEPIAFDPRIFSSDAPPDRYEMDRPDQIDRDFDEIARPELTQQQLVHQDGQSYYQLVGIVRNGFTRPIDRTELLVTLYGPDHQILATDQQYLETLRPGENGIVDIKIYTHPADMPVASYEYLLDSVFVDPRR